MRSRTCWFWESSIQVQGTADAVVSWPAPRNVVSSRVKELALKETAEAHRRLEAGEARGRRLVLRPPP